MPSRKVDIVVARAVQLAMHSGFDTRSAARELVALSDESIPVLTAALLRVDRALIERWSTVAARASDALRTAIDLQDAATMPLAS